MRAEEASQPRLGPDLQPPSHDGVATQAQPTVFDGKINGPDAAVEGFTSLKRKVKQDADASFDLHHLCAVCRKAISASSILQGQFPYFGTQSEDELATVCEVFPQHTTIEHLIRSGFLGCHLCSLLDARLQLQKTTNLSNIRFSPKPVEHLADCIDTSAVPASWKGLVLIGLQVGVFNPIMRRHMVTRDLLYAYNKDYFDDFGLDTGRDHANSMANVRLSTASDATFLLASFWMEKCFREHEICESWYRSPKAPPRRLLDVGTSSANASVKLCFGYEAALMSDDRSPRYLTLSHRWGQQPILRLLEENVQRLHNSFDMKELPRTFQDAVVITRRFGIRYLWVDSLCIIQDSRQDWFKESARMGDIYQGSVCTIAALDSTGDRGGCFSVRNPLAHLPCLIGKNTNGATLMLAPRKRSKLQGKLLRRGWVFQERVLSTRTFFYSSGMLSWECRKQDANEAAPLGTNRPLRENPKQSFMALLTSIPAFSAFPGLADYMPYPDLTGSRIFPTFHAFWIRLLESYTSCKLTRQEDKLVALNGIIRLVENRIGLHSIAGLWREMLLPELLWFLDRPLNTEHNSPCSDSQGYRAPSWSWASLDGVIGNRFQPNQDWKIQWCTTLLDYHVDSKANGQVSAARIRLKGPLHATKWADKENTTHSARYRGWYADHAVAPSEPVLVLLVGRGTCHVDNGLEDLLLDVGIVVNPVEAQRDVYRRVGYFQQCYNASATFPIFHGERASQTADITII